MLIDNLHINKFKEQTSNFWDVKDNASKIPCKEKNKIFPGIKK
jgi:hypothetical protein